MLITEVNEAGFNNLIDSTSIEIFKKIYETLTQSKPLLEKLSIKKKFINYYCASMGITGSYLNEKNEQIKIRGSYLIYWKIEDYVKVASRFLSEEYTEYSKDIEDVGMEILNTLVGNLKNPLKVQGVFINMSLPTAFIGNHHITRNKDCIYQKNLAFTSNIGEVDVVINIEKEV
jgi:CheY-specific phosphatase CheX